MRRNEMDPKKLLKGKKILIVDDEPDVLESLIELLDMCRVDAASSFEEGERLLEDQSYAIAILDIMGVQGFELLKIANRQKIPALMLTAHALSEESLKKSAEGGAAYFAPKDKLRAPGSSGSKGSGDFMTKDFTVQTGESRNENSGKRS
jgi:CheY-like chemotaxis protein